MSRADLGGDAPCWAHLLDEPTEPRAHADDLEVGLVVDLGDLATGSGGAIWSLPHGGDLDANLVRLGPHQSIAAHDNNDVDVVVFVQSGAGEIGIDDQTHRVDADHLALIPKGTQRSMTAGPCGITYLSIHTKRSPLSIGHRAGHDR